MGNKKKKAVESGKRKASLRPNISDKLRNELHGESDRGAMLIAVSFIDEALGQLLAAALSGISANSRDTSYSPNLDELLSPGMNAPLGNYADRVLACYVLGLIDEDFRNALNALGSLRNSFSHYKIERGQLTVEEISTVLQHVGQGGVYDLFYLKVLTPELSFDTDRPARMGLMLITWLTISQILQLTESLEQGAGAKIGVKPLGRFDGPTCCKE